LDYHSFRARYRSPFEHGTTAKPLPAARAAHALLSPGRSLSEARSKEILKAYGIPVTCDELVTSAAEAVRAASAIGYPVVMKATGATLLHKSDRGLVRVGVSS